jgi:hypothetical protein
MPAVTQGGADDGQALMDTAAVAMGRERALRCAARCSRSTSTAILGIPRERRDFLVWCRHGRVPSATRRNEEVPAGRRRSRPPGRHDPTAAHVPPRSGRLPGGLRNVGVQAVRPRHPDWIRATACPNVSDFAGDLPGRRVCPQAWRHCGALCRLSGSHSTLAQQAR